MKKYQIAMYIRLSKEDDDDRDESNSITMQRSLLKRYIAENFADYDLQEFCDDGYSGTNFERPAIKRLLSAVRDSEIDCIVVKDFSRFARDYIELGTYLEQIFPFLRVRFISVNDHYDSINYQGGIADIDVEFKNLLYDLYSKDLSKNIRSTLASIKEDGKYVSAHCPFGYKKDPKDRHRLLIAEDEAVIVCRIFSLTLEGYSTVAIARMFNETHVKTPVEFKIEKGETRRIPKGDRFLWSHSSIRQIITNMVYIGHIAQKKTTNVFGKKKKILNEKENWLVTYNHHEPIIEEDVFNKIQEECGKKRNPVHNPSHPLTGKVVCGNCKKNMQYRRGLNPYFSCAKRYSNGLTGCVEKVNAMYLEQYVLFLLQEKLLAGGKLNCLRKEAVAALDNELQEVHTQKHRLLAKITQLKELHFEAYQDYAMGKSADFKKYHSEIQALKIALEETEAVIQEKECSHLYIEKDGKYVADEIAILSKEMINRYIDKIVVYNEQNIEIVWQ